MLKIPHIIKAYEALGALGGGRVTLVDATSARVRSSDSSKEYDIRWAPDWSTVTSTDNSTKWQQQLGYPIIAVMCASGQLTWNRDVAAKLANVSWKELNDRMKRDYDAVIASVLSDLTPSVEEQEVVALEAKRLLGAAAAFLRERA